MAKSIKVLKPKVKAPKTKAVKTAKPKTFKTFKAKATKPRRVADAENPGLDATRAQEPPLRPMPPLAIGASATVLDRLWGVVMSRRDADPASSHSARLLSRGTAKVAQKFGEEAVECLIEAVAGNRQALVAESADVLYHLLVLWVDADIRPDDVWSELHRREGVSGIAEKSSRLRSVPAAVALNTTKIP